MKALGVYDALKPKIVQGNSIAQAFQFVDTRNAELGFVALSQLHGVTAGTRWEVPANLHAPIRQDAVLLKTGANSEASKAFLAFLKGPEATRDHRAVRLRSASERDVLRHCLPISGFRSSSRSNSRPSRRSRCSSSRRRSPGGLRARRPGSRRPIAAIVSLPMVLPPTVLGFYLLIALGPDGPGGAIASLWGARTLAFTFTGLVIGCDHFVDAVRRAADPQRLRSDRRPAARGGGDAARLAAARLLDRRAAAREPRPADGRGARLRPHRRRSSA